jgi:hypothetical protein
MKKIMLVLIILFLPTAVLADFSVTFENTSDSKMYYELFWVNHPFELPFPARMAGGELGISESVDLNVNYTHGKYFVVWRDGKEWMRRILVVVDDTVKVVTVTPKEAIF